MLSSCRGMAQAGAWDALPAYSTPQSIAESPFKSMALRPSSTLCKSLILVHDSMLSVDGVASFMLSPSASSFACVQLKAKKGHERCRNCSLKGRRSGLCGFQINILAPLFSWPSTSHTCRSVPCRLRACKAWDCLRAGRDRIATVVARNKFKRRTRGSMSSAYAFPGTAAANQNLWFVSAKG